MVAPRRRSQRARPTRAPSPVMPRRFPLAVAPLSPLLLVLAACGGQAPPPDPAPQVVTDTAPAPVSAPVVVTRVDTVTVRDPELEARAVRLELQLAERDAQLEALQSRLAEARNDVVRTLGQIKTSATRAEAASVMAEAELAVQALQRAGGADGKAELAQARELIGRSNEAFATQNYGGAHYAATQAKNLANASRAMVGQEGRRPGERVFAVPVPFDVTSRANLREAPGTTARVVGALDRGQRVVALSYLGEWLRVTDPAGRQGWVFQELLARSAAR